MHVSTIKTFPKGSSLWICISFRAARIWGDSNWPTFFTLKWQKIARIAWSYSFRCKTVFACNKIQIWLSLMFFNQMRIHFPVPDILWANFASDNFSFFDPVGCRISPFTSELVRSDLTLTSEMTIAKNTPKIRIFVKVIWVICSQMIFWNGLFQSFACKLFFKKIILIFHVKFIKFDYLIFLS